MLQNGFYRMCQRFYFVKGNIFANGKRRNAGIPQNFIGISIAYAENICWSNLQALTLPFLLLNCSFRNAAFIWSESASGALLGSGFKIGSPAHENLLKPILCHH